MNLDEQLLSSFGHIFRAVKQTGEGALSQLREADINHVFGGNSVSTLIRHLHGNMMSRWTDMFTTDGEKPWRDRDGEFSGTPLNYDEMLALWEDGWSAVFAVLDSLRADSFSRNVVIRGQEHTLVEALHRHLQHYSSHVGQIVLMAKTLCGNDWDYLTIPPGQSKTYSPRGIAGEPPVKG